MGVTTFLDIEVRATACRSPRWLEQRAAPITRDVRASSRSDDHDDSARESSRDHSSVNSASDDSGSAASPTEPSPNRRPLAGIRVLVLDDERDVRELIARILQHSGATVERAATTREAMTSIEATRPDVVLSDITLRNEDGFAFVERLRTHARPELRNLPVAAMTAHTFDDAPNRTAASGFQEHLVKPIQPKHLIEVVARLAESGEASVT
jgi:CheY-like chemotaxis protein